MLNGSALVRALSVLTVIAGLATLSACERAPEAHPEGAQQAPVSHPAGNELDTSVPAEVVAAGLDTPWALAFASDGRILITERPGRIRVIHEGQLQPQPWAVVDVAALSEAGLLGITLAPDHERSRHVYVFGVFLRDRSLRYPRRGLYARVIRFTDDGLTGSDPTVIIDDLPAGQLHAGGALGFGPDGMLYVTIGDTFDQASAQNPEALSGAILRFRPDGTVPADNPRSGSPVWAKGLRNVQGLAWHPDTGELLAIEHGPTGLAEENRRTDQDELNVIRPGGNYGWPEVTGASADPRFEPPLLEWTPAIAPGGLAIPDSSLHPAWHGSVLVTGLRGQQLRRVQLEAHAGSLRVVADEALLVGELGRLRAVAVSPHGHVYIATSNRDGRGIPTAADDRLLRLLPRPDNGAVTDTVR